MCNVKALSFNFEQQLVYSVRKKKAFSRRVFTTRLRSLINLGQAKYRF